MTNLETCATLHPLGWTTNWNLSLCTQVGSIRKST